jgi:hypothetical protein
MIREAKRALARQLLRHGGISGVGIEAAEGGGERIKVYLAADDHNLRALIAPAVEGYPGVIEVVGRIVPHPGAA